MAGASPGVEGRFKRKQRRERIERRVYFVASFVLLMLIWEACRAVGLINPKLFP